MAPFGDSIARPEMQSSLRIVNTASDQNTDQLFAPFDECFDVRHKRTGQNLFMVNRPGQALVRCSILAYTLRQVLISPLLGNWLSHIPIIPVYQDLCANLRRDGVHSG
jgi:hypothetical protein